MQKVVLQSLEGNFEGILLFGELGFRRLQIRSFGFHHVAQQLFLQAVLRNREVNESRLRLHLGLVMGIRQFRLKYQTELWIKVDLLVPQFYRTATIIRRSKKTRI